MKAGRLSGQVALVTGASRGIGASVARLFAQEGAAVAIGYLNTPEMKKLAQELAAEINSNGGKAVAVDGNLADPHGPEQLVSQTRAALGEITTLVANGAALGRTPWLEISIDEWDRFQNVNLRGTWLLAKAAYLDLKKHQGSIITVTSVMVETGQAGAVHYSASKAGIIGLTRALAREIGEDGVRINAVMPGAIRTELEVELDPDETAVSEAMYKLQALKRRGYADDLAGTFLFLASKESSFITGQVINVDGGWVMR